MLHLRPIMLDLFPNYNLKTMSRNMLFTYKIPMHSLLYPTIHDQTPHIQTKTLKIHISYNSIGSQAIQVMTTNMQKSILTTIQVELCVVCGVSVCSFLELKFRQSIFFRNSQKHVPSSAKDMRWVTLEPQPDNTDASKASRRKLFPNQRFRDPRVCTLILVQVQMAV